LTISQRTGTVAPERHRQAGVVRGVALAHGEDGEARLGARLHHAPDLQRRPQACARGQAFAFVEALQLNLVHAMVAGEIAAAAQHRTQRPRQAVQLLEAVRDQVEKAGPAGRDQDVRRAEQAFVVGFAHQRAQLAHEFLDRGGLVEQPLVAFEAGQQQPRRTFDGARHRHRFVQRAAARAFAGQAEFDQHRQRPRQRVSGHFLGQSRHPGQGVGQHVAGEIGVVVQQLQHGAHVAARHQLVGDQHAPHAKAVRHLHLHGIRQGDAPGAVGQLRAEQLRAHGGLAVRRQQHFVTVAEGAHPVQVVAQRRGLQDGHRIAGVAVQHVPALDADRALAQRRRDRQAFHARLQQLFFETRQREAAVGQGIHGFLKLFNSSSRSRRSRPALGITSRAPGV
jgi:hypothetical protein